MPLSRLGWACVAALSMGCLVELAWAKGEGKGDADGPVKDFLADEVEHPDEVLLLQEWKERMDDGETIDGVGLGEVKQKLKKYELLRSRLDQASKAVSDLQTHHSDWEEKHGSKADHLFGLLKAHKAEHGKIDREQARQMHAAHKEHKENVKENLGAVGRQLLEAKEEQTKADKTLFKHLRQIQKYVTKHGSPTPAKKKKPARDEL